MTNAMVKLCPLLTELELLLASDELPSMAVDAEQRGGGTAAPPAIVGGTSGGT